MFHGAQGGTTFVGRLSAISLLNANHLIVKDNMAVRR